MEPEGSLQISQDPVTGSYLRIHFNIICPFILGLPFRLSDYPFLCISFSPMHATCPAHLILFDLIILIIFHIFCKTSKIVN